jgi:hypothetical protein
MKLLTNTFLLAAFLFLPVRVFSQTQQDELEQIRQNYIGTLISSNDESDLLNRILSGIPPETEMSDQVVVELHQRYPFNMEKIKGYMESINEDGSWPDINYRYQTLRMGCQEACRPYTGTGKTLSCRRTFVHLVAPLLYGYSSGARLLVPHETCLQELVV